MRFVAVPIVLIFLAAPAFALTAAADKAAPLTLAEANAVLSSLGIEVKEVREAPVRGMWELVMEREGQRSVAYLDQERRHLMPGPIFDIASRSLVGAQVAAPPQPAKVDVAAIPLKGSVVMGNPNGKKRLIVFTDPDCPFCARLHWELGQLTRTEPDLAIYVKMFPLKIHPGAYDKARVILKENSPKLLDDAFAGKALPAPGNKDDGKGVDDSIRLGESLGITSTPTMILPGGRILPGARSAAEIKKLLAIEAM